MGVSMNALALGIWAAGHLQSCSAPGMELLSSESLRQCTSPECVAIKVSQAGCEHLLTAGTCGELMLLNGGSHQPIACDENWQDTVSMLINWVTEVLEVSD